jgi:hypothetical protein
MVEIRFQQIIRIKFTLMERQMLASESLYATAARRMYLQLQMLIIQRVQQLQVYIEPNPTTVFVLQQL